MKRDSVFRLILILCMLFLFRITSFNIPCIIAAEICVDINGNAPPDLTCYKSIQTAIEEAATGDVIVVYQGTYKENIDFLGKAITVRSTDPDDSSVVSKTIIDGSRAGSVVTFNNGEVGSSILNGLTIKSGSASTGGGIFCESSSPTIINCEIIYNSSTSFGGGIYCSSASPRIEKCTLYGNSASFYGGGIYCYDSSPNVYQCKIGIDTLGNSATSGGGIACLSYSSAIIENCTIQKNGGSTSGGGIYCSYSSPIFKKCVIRGNSSSSYPPSDGKPSGGGGIYCESSSLDMENCIISTNSTNSPGGGFSISGSSLSLKSCTVNRNSANLSGGAIFCKDDSSLIIKNCIIWGNSPDEISGCSATVSYSDIKAEDGTIYPGEGNINEDPLFLYPEKEDYYPQPGSQCIDAGTNDGAPETDINGKIRPLDGDGDDEYICDMGAYEFVPPQEYHVAPDGIDPMGTPCFESIQTAINTTYNFDVVVVYPGIYKETIYFSNKPIILRSTDPDDRHIVDATVIDGEQASSVVTFYSGEGKYSVLRGFTLQNAKDQGIYCHYSSPSIENCTIGKNYRYGIYCYQSSPIIKACDIQDNNKNGIYCNYSSPIIKQCTIRHNLASGIYCNRSSPNIIQCNISWNSTQNGGGIYCNRSSPSIENCVINWNLASDGGGIYCENSSPVIIHSTITENIAHSGGGIYCSVVSSPKITNSVLWNNTPNKMSGCTPAVSFSNIRMKEEEEVYPGTGNINEDPLFVSTKSGDFHLQSNSPCIDAGDPNSMLLEDLDGILRPQDGDWNNESISDMGAYEFWKKLCYRDFDMDGFGDSNDVEEAVEGICLDGYVENYLDCNDNDPDRNPNVPEIPDNYVDENCDGIVLDPPPPPRPIDPNIYVDPNGDAPNPCYETIQSAINDADHGHVIIVMPGTYKENINFQGKAITVKSIDSNNPTVVAATIIDGNQVDSVVTFNHGEGPHSVLKGLTIRNGKAFNGGGIYCKRSSPSIENCVITENTALLFGGGGIYCDIYSPAIKDCTITNNSSASDGGGIYCSDSLTSIENCTIAHNSARFYGGGIFCNTVSTNIKDSLVNNNSALLGAGIYCRYSSLDITNSTIKSNSASNGYGGGICSHNSILFFKSCVIENNSAANGYGGGIYNAESSMMFEYCTVNSNSGGYGGGVYYIDSQRNVESDFKYCSIKSNNAYYSGGGIYCINAKISFEKCDIESNSASYKFGGGIHCDSSLLNISDCRIFKNSANGSYGAGGGIYCSNTSDVNIETSTISGNSAREGGGGVYCIDASHSLKNCIISTNSATTNSGGGIYCVNSSSNLSNCTMSRNSAETSGGGIFCDDESSPVIKNCIIWNNSPDEISDCTPIASYSDIHIEDGSVHPGIGNINQDPLFLYPELENYYLRPFSPCIDTGDDEDAPDTDIAGKSRPLDGNKDGIALYDMGAYEFVLPTEYHVEPNESIQDRIDEAYYFDIITVSQGTYTENIDFKNKPITLISEDPNDPNSVKATIINGGGNGNAVTFERGEREYSVLRGFTIQQGSGRGIYCFNTSSPRIENCIIKNNSSYGIECNKYSSPHIKNCFISNNGNGIFCFNHSHPNIEDCIIQNNSYHGIHCNNSSPRIENCLIEDNRNIGIFCYSNSSPYIQNCIIRNNKSQGICCTSSSPRINICQITDNSGSGIHCNSSSPNITNCLILRNSSSYGGGIYCNRSSPTITHCNIYDNSAFMGSGLYCENNSSPIIKGCIFWKNFPENEQISGSNCNAKVIYSDIQMMEGVYPGTGNINEDPLFRNPEEDDLHLQSNSPCIEGGDPNCTLTMDMDGEERPWDADRDGNAICDMGADEYKCVCYKDNDGDGYGDPNHFEEAIDCICSEGFVLNDKDCNDNDPNINPGALEIPWNGMDDNCEGYVDTLPPKCQDSFLSFIRLVVGEEEYMVSFGINELITREAPAPYGIPLSFKDPYDSKYYDYDVKDCQDYASYHWIVQIDPNMDPNSNPLLTWEPEKLPTKEDYLWMLINGKDKDGNVLVNDMTNSASYQIRPEDGKVFSIIWVPDVIVEDYISLQMGWNLISLPLDPVDPNRQAIFPEAKAVWYFDPNLQKYAYIKENDHMESGLGYWVLYPENKTVPLEGTFMKEFSLDLKKGWNMIGALNKQTSIDVTPGDISALYKFEQGYTFMENLENPVLESKMGYWVLPSEDSVLYASLLSASTGTSEDEEFSGARLKEASSPEILKAYIIAFGQEKTDYMNIDKVTFGLSNIPKRALSPPYPPSTTISLSIIDHSYEASYAYDIRFMDSNSQTWILWLQNMAVSGPDFYPLLKWEIPSSMEGTLELRKGDSGTDEILVNDMKATSSYQLKEGDGELFIVLWKTKCVPEICDGIDNDCDGDVDEEDAIGCKTCYRDEDGDGYGIDGDTLCLCDPNDSGYSIQAGDCNDLDPNTHPGATELCDGKDNGCNGMIPSVETTDADKDGVVACKDCDDNDATIYPDAPEYCDEKDNDCNGEIDEEGAKGCTSYYRDEDNDGYGLDVDTRCLCAPEDIYTATLGGDCDDTDPSIYPRPVRIVSAKGYPGQTDVAVPIAIDDFVGFAGGDIFLTYDPNVLTARKVIIAPLIQNFFTDSHIIEAKGQVNLVIAHPEGLESASGTLAEIIFDVSEEAVIGTVVPLVFETLRIYDGDGEPHCIFPINGEFRIVERCLKGDLNEDAEITAADAILVLKIAVGKLPPSEYQLCAGDVNGDDKINAADAILILRAAVGKETIFLLEPDHGLPGATVKIIGWNFGESQNDSVLYFGDIPAEPITWMDHEIVTAVPSNIPPGMIEVKLVNAYGFSSNSRVFMVGLENKRLRSIDLLFRTGGISKAIHIPGISAAPCDLVNIPVETGDAADIAGMDIDLRFDPAILMPVMVERTTLTDGFLLMFNASENGRILASLASDKGINEGSGALINVIFDVSSNARKSDSTEITIEDVKFYDEEANPIEATVSQDGQVLIDGEGLCEPEQTYGTSIHSTGIGPSYYYPYNPYAGYYHYTGNLSQQGDWRTTFWRYPSGNGYNYPFGNGYNYTYQGSSQIQNPAFQWIQNRYDYYQLPPWNYHAIYPDVSWFILW